MNQSDHEFTAEQNQVLTEVSKRMKLFAGLMVGSSLLSLLVTGFQLTQMGAEGSALIGGVIVTTIGLGFYIVIAFFTISAAASLQAIVTSIGGDVPYMINALNSLKKLFGIQYWLIVILLTAVILFVIGMPILFVSL